MVKQLPPGFDLEMDASLVIKNACRVSQAPACSPFADRGFPGLAALIRELVDSGE